MSRRVRVAEFTWSECVCVCVCVSSVDRRKEGAADFTCLVWWKSCIDVVVTCFYHSLSFVLLISSFVYCLPFYLHLLFLSSFFVPYSSLFILPILFLALLSFLYLLHHHVHFLPFLLPFLPPHRFLPPSFLPSFLTVFLLQVIDCKACPPDADMTQTWRRHDADLTQWLRWKIRWCDISFLSFVRFLQVHAVSAFVFQAQSVSVEC